MAGGVELELPWPSYALSQNGAHGNHYAVAAKRKAYHRAATEALDGISLPDPGEGNIRLTVRFHAPTKARPDLDNALTRLKAGIDALAQTWGVNDNRFEYDLRHGEKYPGGKVVVTIGAAS